MTVFGNRVLESERAVCDGVLEREFGERRLQSVTVFGIRMLEGGVVRLGLWF